MNYIPPKQSRTYIRKNVFKVKKYNNENVSSNVNIPIRKKVVEYNKNFVGKQLYVTVITNVKKTMC
jgi:hypothetical protein